MTTNSTIEKEGGFYQLLHPIAKDDKPKLHGATADEPESGGVSLAKLLPILGGFMSCRLSRNV
jgi:hypothetical protein